MEGISVTVETKYYDDELTAVSNATAEIREALIGKAYVIDANTNGGVSKPITVTLDIATPDVGASESSLNVTPNVTSFEEFEYDGE